MKGDHFVSKAYLKSFSDASGSLWVYGKDYLDVKKRHPSAICREHGGSYNQFLGGEDAIEGFLSEIENNWADTILTISPEATADLEQYYKARTRIAQYIAYLRSIPPHQKVDLDRIVVHQLQETWKLLLEGGHFPPLPDSLKGLPPERLLPRLSLAEGYPSAMSFRTSPQLVDRLFRSKWIHLVNRTPVPFLTSDNPVCFLSESDQAFLSYLPLSPDKAVIINPLLKERNDGDSDPIPEFAFSSEHLVRRLNDEVVKHAKHLIIANQKCEEILESVKTFKDWEAKTEMESLRTETGTLTKFVHRVRPTNC